MSYISVVYLMSSISYIRCQTHVWSHCLVIQFNCSICIVPTFHICTCIYCGTSMTFLNIVPWAVLISTFQTSFEFVSFSIIVFVRVFVFVLVFVFVQYWAQWPIISQGEVILWWHSGTDDRPLIDLSHIPYFYFLIFSNISNIF